MRHVFIGLQLASGAMRALEMRQMDDDSPLNPEPVTRQDKDPWAFYVEPPDAFKEAWDELQDTVARLGRRHAVESIGNYTITPDDPYQGGLPQSTPKGSGLRSHTKGAFGKKRR